MLSNFKSEKNLNSTENSLKIEQHFVKIKSYITVNCNKKLESTKFFKSKVIKIKTGECFK